MDEFLLSPMREFMLMTENLVDRERLPAATVQSAPGPSALSILEDLRHLAFKLRAFTESRQGDLGYGVELGMQRAADMIEHVITRHKNVPGD